MAMLGCSIQRAAVVPQRRQVTPECAKMFEKTVMCRYFPRCSRGKDCMYAHAEGELRRRPNRTKTAMCVGYRHGRCPYLASECQFAHGPEDLLNSEGEHVMPVCRAEGAKLAMLSAPSGLEFTPTNSGTATPVSRWSRQDFSSASSGASTPPTPPTVSESGAIALLTALAWHMNDSEERLGPNAMGLDEDLRVLARLRL